MESKLADVRDINKLASSIGLAKDIITKDYLYELEKYEVCELPSELKEIEISEYTRLYRFRKLVSDKKENTIDKLVTVLNAAYTSDATVITVIKGEKNHTDYYLGVVSKDIYQEKMDIGTQGETFKGVLSGNFPGLEIESLDDESIRRLCGNIFAYNYISSVSGIASLRNEKDKSIEKYVQGIEHLVDSLQGKQYSIVLIADPVNASELADAKTGYENLYTQLSPFLKTSLSFNESESITITQSQTDGVTDSIGESTSLTQNYSKTSGWSETSTKGTSDNKDTGHLVGNALGVGAGALATVLTGGAAAPLIAAGAFVGGSVGSGVIGSSGTNYSDSYTATGSMSESSGHTTSRNSSKSTQRSSSTGQSEGNSQGRTMQFNNENKTVKDLLAKIDKHIERLEKCETFGAFNCSTYVISSDPETNAIVANGYNALMRGDSSSLQSSCINNWHTGNQQFKNIKQFLEKFSHPMFYRRDFSDIIVTPASVTNSYELAVGIGMPKKSINGLPVFESASFGRNVYQTDLSGRRRKKIFLGNIYHMGSKESTEVELDVKSLAMHTFITGSTGSGKSNTVYQLLRELKQQRISYLVIEPAKGEYKHVFGNEDASVYGSNPYYSPILRLNPFRFPKGIHVLEHIDRLIEIFNVCWPMYAAMPAVLKDSVERAYISAGWDLSKSVNKYSEQLYPTFVDVLAELTNVVNESAFSQEVKDNYTGSLATRIKSLTNGIYGQIFVNDEIGDKKLFDENVIVDLSRIGSVETKSMIMGILVMRLQEYRMTSGDMNADLKHVTILEEAHNLLKRTSTEQSSESSNLLGKSVEMLSNAIAEVRTYGEGFVIADQAPGLLDMSVIRNTNTKIIMRLPDAEDRNLVGKSANLSEEQIKELAKLPTGVAAVYQNNWLEPILCKVEFEDTNDTYQPKLNEIKFDNDDKRVILSSLLNKAAGEKLDFTMGELTEIIISSSLPTSIKTRAIKVLRQNGKVKLSDISGIIYDMVASPEIEKSAEQAESIEEWKDTFIYSDDSFLIDFDENLQNTVAECILREQIVRYDKPDEYLETWYKFINGEVM